MSSRTTSIALAALAVAVVTTAAQASPAGSDVITVRVSLADLNLASQPGASIALQRIRRAAAWICGDEPLLVELDRMALYDTCLRSTVGSAVASLDNPVVTELYAGPPRSSQMATR
jgi:UrcA family protein